MLKMELLSKRKKGRPQRRFIYVVKEDMQRVGMIELDISDEVKLKQMIHWQPLKEAAEEEDVCQVSLL